jgi:acetyltransferase-like isoleucine patch superfamily enzyme
MTPARRVIGRGFIGLAELGRRVRRRSFSWAAGGAFAAFGAGTALEPPIRLSGVERMAVGRDVFVGPGCWFQTLPEGGTDVALELGDGVRIAGSCVLSAVAHVRLGRKVLLARNVYISDHIHAYEDTTEAVLDQGVARVEPVDIGDGAWLGQNVVVCPGVSIGRGAVVGANAVVVDDIPDYCLAVGAPARVVRTFAAAAAAGQPVP